MICIENTYHKIEKIVVSSLCRSSKHHLVMRKESSGDVPLRRPPYNAMIRNTNIIITHEETIHVPLVTKTIKNALTSIPMIKRQLTVRSSKDSLYNC